MAGIELSVLSCQCLDRLIPELETPKSEVDAWLDNPITKKLRLIGGLQQPMSGSNYTDFTRQSLID
jgi:hypothetical protein